jgi:hypothetical protein
MSRLSAPRRTSGIKCSRFPRAACRDPRSRIPITVRDATIRRRSLGALKPLGSLGCPRKTDHGDPVTRKRAFDIYADRPQVVHIRRLAATCIANEYNWTERIPHWKSEPTDRESLAGSPTGASPQRASLDSSED